MAIKVSYEELATQAKSLRDGYTDAESLLSRLGGQIGGLVTSGFMTDKASGEFERTYEEFQKGATKALDALNGLATFLDKTVETLQSTDEQLAGALKQ
jgi:WXG100 family type VII secretion target